MATTPPPGLTPGQRRALWLITKVAFVIGDLGVVVVICLGVSNGSTADRIVGFLAAAYVGSQALLKATTPPA